MRSDDAPLSHPGPDAGEASGAAEAPDAPTQGAGRHGLSRRELFLATAGLGVGGALGATATAQHRAAPGTPPRPGAQAVAAAGAHQAGVTRPATPQTFGLLACFDLPTATSATLPGVLAAVGHEILALTGGDHPAVPDGAGDLSITVGLGPRLVSTVRPDAPGSREIARFAGDDLLDETHRGGDVLLAAYASDPGVLDPAVRAVAAQLAGTRPRWRYAVFRGHGEGGVNRNPLGFHDGVIVPRGEDELAREVWLDAPGTAGGTIMVVRVLRLDVATFTALEVPGQERVIGRRRSDGAPLSGGGPMDEVDLRAKAADGQFLTPPRSHARAAHPSFTGSGLMLRRSYGYDNGLDADGEPDTGLAFVSFQRELRTFEATQLRMDETDDLMTYATPRTTATFLVLPGFSADQPLGATLFEA